MKTKAFIAVIILTLSVLHAQGEIVEWNFTGTFTESVLATIQVGDTFSYKVVYDSATPDLNPLQPVLGAYEIISGTLFVNGSLFYDWSAPTWAQIDKNDNAYGVIDRLQAETQDTYGFALVQLFDASQTAHSDDVLAGFVPDVNDYADGNHFNVEVFAFPMDSNTAYGNISSITSSVVPEPATALSLLIGGGLLGLIRHIKKSYGQY